MTSYAMRAVIEFHRAFGLPLRATPSVDPADVPPDLADLRVRLIGEEFDEYITAVNADDLAGIADALADLAYVVYGAALTYGIDLDAVLAEVHRSNLTKDVPGEDGKPAKSERYSPPDVADVLARQEPLPIYGTSAGVQITDGLVEHLADQAETGYELPLTLEASDDVRVLTSAFDSETAQLELTFDADDELDRPAAPDTTPDGW